MSGFLKKIPYVSICFAVVATLVVIPAGVRASSAYGSGTYGSCQYGSCGISLISSGFVDLSVTPGAGTTCSVQSDSVTVTTSSSTGYTLSLSDSDTNNQMPGSNSGTINPVTGSAGSPGSLAANTWGYRVDGVNGFGGGSTTAFSNGSVPGSTFAPVPVSSGTADTIATSDTAASSGAETSVWYGLCANAGTTNGTYEDTVTYTAVIN